MAGFLNLWPKMVSVDKPLVYQLIEAAAADPSEAEQLLTEHPEANNARLPDMQETALHYLAVEKNLKAVRFLVDHGADVNTRNASGTSVLMEVCSMGHSELAVLLLERGANPNVRDQFGDTALHKACQKCNPVLVAALLQAGAEPSPKDEMGATPLHAVVSLNLDELDEALKSTIGGFLRSMGMRQPLPVRKGPSEETICEIVDLLWRKGAKLNAWDACRQTPLHLAAEQADRYPTVVELLIKRGADTGRRNMFGQTFMDLVPESTRERIQASLKLRRAERQASTPAP
jgi:ankyrin repeat protein